MIVKAFAKINLFLHITGKRSDGYHFIDSVFLLFPSLYDVVRLEISEKTELQVDGEHAENAGSAENNIVLKAVSLLTEIASDKKTGVKIRLQKNIPVGAGLGGGSSDAATVMLALNDMWQLNLPIKKLAQIGLSLGADVPFFINKNNAYVSGIGENIEPINIDKMHILLVNPNRHISTVEVYKKFDGEFSKKINNIDKIDFEYIKNASNDLQQPALEIEPKINDALEFLNKQEGCVFSRMSGSGATCFGVFESEAALNIAYKAAFGSFWVCK